MILTLAAFTTAAVLGIAGGRAMDRAIESEGRPTTLLRVARLGSQ